MPIENGVGYGEYTGVKIEHLPKILEIQMPITKTVIKEHAPYSEPEYRYVDLAVGNRFTP